MTEITPELIDEFVPTLKGYADCAGTDGFAINAACLMLETIADKLRTGQLSPSGDEVEERVIAEVVAWLNNASIWLNGGECCGQKCSDGVCCAPACIWGDELKLLHSVATALETGEWRNAQSV